MSHNFHAFPRMCVVDIGYLDGASLRQAAVSNLHVYQPDSPSLILRFYVIISCLCANETDARLQKTKRMGKRSLI